jgi:hypothetical protein
MVADYGGRRLADRRKRVRFKTFITMLGEMACSLARQEIPTEHRKLIVSGYSLVSLLQAMASRSMV